VLSEGVSSYSKILSLFFLLLLRSFVYFGNWALSFMGYLLFCEFLRIFTLSHSNILFFIQSIFYFNLVNYIIIIKKPILNMTNHAPAKKKTYIFLLLKCIFIKNLLFLVFLDYFHVLILKIYF
jgi:hypothetical protein